MNILFKYDTRILITNLYKIIAALFENLHFSVEIIYILTKASLIKYFKQFLKYMRIFVTFMVHLVLILEYLI